MLKQFSLSLRFSVVVIMQLLMMTFATLPAAADDITSDSLKHAADLCMQSDRYIEALELYTRGMEKAKDEGNSEMQMACIGNIGNVHAHFKDFELAAHYFLQCYEQAVKEKNVPVQSKSIHNLTACYCLLGKPEEAKKFLKLQSQMPLEDKNLAHYYLLAHQAMIAGAEGNDRSALTLAEQTLHFAQSHGIGIAYELSAMSSMAEFNMKLGNKDVAESIYLDMAEQAHAKGFLDHYHSACDALASLYNSNDEPEKAAEYIEKARLVEDSIYDKQRYNATKNRLFEYEAEQTRNEILQLNSKINLQWWVIVVFAFLTITLIILSVIIFRQKSSLSAAYRVLVEKSRENIKKSEANESSLMPAEQAAKLLSRIQEVMNNMEVISDNEFNLTTLAKLVDSNTKYVSWVINDSYQKNFKSLLNEYRIREASRMLTDNDTYGHLTIQAISESVGYKSQASFIQAFKTIIGMTPSTYQKVARNSSFEM